MRLYKKDGSSWVANFNFGLSNLSTVVDFPSHDKLVVVAGGMGYVMTPENEKPLQTIGLSLKHLCQYRESMLVLTDDIYVYLFDAASSEPPWCSERISYDGIEEVKVEGRFVSGMVYAPTQEADEWTPFSIDLETKETTGGSW